MLPRRVDGSEARTSWQLSRGVFWHVLVAGEAWSRRRRGAQRAKREERARSPARGVLTPERPDRSGHRARRSRALSQ